MILVFCVFHPTFASDTDEGLFPHFGWYNVLAINLYCRILRAISLKWSDIVLWPCSKGCRSVSRWSYAIWKVVWALYYLQRKVDKNEWLLAVVPKSNLAIRIGSLCVCVCWRCMWDWISVYVCCSLNWRFVCCSSSNWKGLNGICVL